MKKKIISIITLLCLLVSCLPMSAFADENIYPEVDINNLYIDKNASTPNERIKITITGVNFNSKTDEDKEVIVTYKSLVKNQSYNYYLSKTSEGEYSGYIWCNKFAGGDDLGIYNLIGIDFIGDYGRTSYHLDEDSGKWLESKNNYKVYDEPTYKSINFNSEKYNVKFVTDVNHNCAIDGHINYEEEYYHCSCIYCGYTHHTMTDWHYHDCVSEENASVNSTYKLKIKHCENCSKVSEYWCKSHSHEYGNWTVVKEPSCTSQGIMSGYCVNCGIKYVTYNSWPNNGFYGKYYGEVTGHEVGELLKYDAPTCSKNGYRKFICKKCNQLIEEELERPEGCDYGNWVTTKEPTCKEKGVKERTCRICGNKQTQELAISTTHTYGNWVTTKEPTNDEYGLKIRKCTICNKEEKESIVPLNHEHIYSYKITQKNGYDKTGEYVRICDCGDIYYKKTIASWDKTSSISIKDTQISKTYFKIKTTKKLYNVYKAIILNGGEKITINNSKPTTKYQVKYSTKSSMSNAKTKTITSNSIKIGSLKKNTKYYVQVRNGYIDPNGVTHWSKWSSKKVIKTKK